MISEKPIDNLLLITIFLVNFDPSSTSLSIPISLSLTVQPTSLLQSQLSVYSFNLLAFHQILFFPQEVHAL